MMLPNRISAKLFIDNPQALQVTAFIPVFHSWIREARVPGVPIDVANYLHVKDGPGLMLIGHAGDYAVDFRDGRAGLLYVHKRDWPGATLADRLHTTLEGLLLGARLMENETRFEHAVTFNTGELELTFPDRLNAPNMPETFAALQNDVRAVFGAFYGTDNLDLIHTDQDERSLLTIAVQAPLAPPLAELQGQLPTVALV